MKKLLTGVISLALAASMSVPAFAAENSATNDGTAGTDITVNGKYQAAAAAADVISVDLVWDAMDFTYTAPSKGTWNAQTHQYDTPTAGGWAWGGVTETKTAPVITVTNHSNLAVKAHFVFNSAVEELNGDFTKSTLTLGTAEETTVSNAPKDETSFSVSGGDIDANQTIGTITVTVTNTSTLYTAEELLATADQTGSFKLGCNIDLGTTPLAITSKDYTLDLNGFTITGSVNRDGVIQISATNSGAGLKATIKNGTVVNTDTESNHAVHAKYSTVTLENCTLSGANGLFTERAAVNAKDCIFKAQRSNMLAVANTDSSSLTLSGNVKLDGGGGLVDRTSATTTVLAGTYNFDVSSYVDTTLYDVTNDGTTWTVTAK